MARVKRNIVLEGLSGILGDQLVFKRDKAGRTIVSVRPQFDENREFSSSQRAQQERFLEAAAYARTAAQTTPIYAEKAQGTAKSAYNVAMADWFHSPEVGDIDLNGYSGGPGQVIRAKVVDDTQVKQVTIMITTSAGTLVERGEMQPEQGVWYTYTTTADCPAGEARVIITGLDLPGNAAVGEAAVNAE